MTDIVVPTLGESVSEATVAKWLKRAGDAVRKDETLVELETDKVSVEVSAPEAGVLTAIVAAEGATVQIGALLGHLGAVGAQAAAVAAAPKPEAAKLAPAPAAAQAPPSVQRIAAESGIDLSTFAGTGKDGRLTKSDALAVLEARGPAPAPVAPASLPRTLGEREERVKMTRLRQTVARRLKEAQNTAAMLTTFNEADMSAVMAARSKYKDQFEKKHGVKLGFMSFFVKACVAALKEIPNVNAEIDGDDIIYKNYYDLGIAVGTGTEIADRLPSYWRHYNGRVPPEMRVDKLLSWLDQPVTERPTMLTLYFSDTDDVGHEFGPGAEETKYAAWNVDRYIERLMNGLRARKIDKKVNVILVSDHGMAPVDQRNAIIMDDLFDIEDKKIADPILTTGEIWQIFPKPGKEDYIIDRLKNIKQATCWRKSEIPARLHYSEGKRIAPIVCSSDEGWFMTTKRRHDEQKKSPDFAQTRGAHGYDNRYQSMGATFVAHGPAFKRGYVAEPFSNVEVYNVMCKILGLKPAKNDGDLNRVRGMLR